MKEAVDYVSNENPNFTPRVDSHKDFDDSEF